MIDVIVSVTNQDDYKSIKTTLNSLEADLPSVIVISSNQEIAQLLNQEYPEVRVVMDSHNSHIEHFYSAIYQIESEKDVMTFAKAGDVFCGSDILTLVTNTFNTYTHLNVVHGGVRSLRNYALYTNPGVAIQGWFFKREFLEYYTFLKMFQNDVEFAMNLAYITHTKPHQMMEMNFDVIQMNSFVENVGQACKHYFNNVLPSQHFFDGALGLAFMCDIMCDCYVTYIQALNNNLDEEEMIPIVRDIQEFYNYFTTLELTDDLTILLQAYNSKMRQVYSSNKENSFTKAIPTLTFIEFLNQNGER